MNPSGGDRSFVLPFAFAMTVSMWAVAYVCRLPAVMAPSWVVLGLMLAVVALWGWLTAWRTHGGWLAGVMVGAAASVLNLLILGSLLAPSDGGAVGPSALLWVPGSIVIIALISGGFAAAGVGKPDTTGDTVEWTALFSKVAVAATFLLLVAGGLVTSSEAGPSPASSASVRKRTGGLPSTFERLTLAIGLLSSRSQMTALLSDDFRSSRSR